ncbi:hypothetical protein T11_10990 [Trichinella zimbabwensis]|uniref:Uncharacterized protein n=1 Tax=Trichinella zimbabwensis TaxID=268475 RepID=A0A0V1GN22_9BILA|nr:hypothetical protein T11_10990 [Trichinella zimbabwensis]
MRFAFALRIGFTCLYQIEEKRAGRFNFDILYFAKAKSLSTCSLESFKDIVKIFSPVDNTLNFLSEDCDCHHSLPRRCFC